MTFTRTDLSVSNHRELSDYTAGAGGITTETPGHVPDIEATLRDVDIGLPEDAPADPLARAALKLRLLADTRGYLIRQFAADEARAIEDAIQAGLPVKEE